MTIGHWVAVRQSSSPPLPERRHFGPIAAYGRTAKPSPVRFRPIVEPEGATRIRAAPDQRLTGVGYEFRHDLRDRHEQLHHLREFTPLS